MPGALCGQVFYQLTDHFSRSTVPGLWFRRLLFAVRCLVPADC